MTYRITYQGFSRTYNHNKEYDAVRQFTQDLRQFGPSQALEALRMYRSGRGGKGTLTINGQAFPVHGLNASGNRISYGPDPV